MHDNERNKAKRLLCSKDPTFSLNLFHSPFDSNIEQKCIETWAVVGQYSTESIKSLESFTLSYSCQQNAKVLNNSVSSFAILFILLLSYICRMEWLSRAPLGKVLTTLCLKSMPDTQKSSDQGPYSLRNLQVGLIS